MVWIQRPPLQFQCLQILPEFATQIVALERELHRRFQEAQLVAGVMAFSFEGIAVNLFFLEQLF